MKKVLVVGGGGREHAICWKLAQSPKIEKLYCAPGNAGIASVAECVPIGAEDVEGICAFAKENAIDMAVIGPEVPLAMGIVDALEPNWKRPSASTAIPWSSRLTGWRRAKAWSWPRTRKKPRRPSTT